jgi:hypothetical protein
MKKYLKIVSLNQMATHPSGKIYSLNATGKPSWILS